MAKIQWKPGTLLNPVPVVLISCGEKEKANLITVAWAGTVCSDPVMVGVSIRPERHSHQLIQANGELVINLPNRRMVRAVDFCGVRSGREVDKFKVTGLTKEPAGLVRPPLIREAPLALECKVESVSPLGSHDLFIAKVVAVQVEEALIDPNGRLNLAKADLITYVHGHYWTLDQAVGSFGFSVRKKQSRR
jgi:flavin reductase (DIM6/NTAB) family NADH-FMN oxidoreductase RutF